MSHRCLSLTTPSDSSTPNSVCILRLSALGDVSHIVPVVRTIQAQWPSTKITWIIGKLEHALVENIEDIEFIVFDKSRGWAANTEVWKQLRGRRFDVLLHMQAALRASVLSSRIRAKVKVGFDRARARDGQWLFTNRKIEARPNQHVIDGFFGFLDAIGINEHVKRWDIPISEQDEEFARSRLGDKPTLVINACSSSRARNFRNWRAERYAAVIDYAQKSYGLNIVLTGGPTDIEREMADSIVDKASDDVTNLVGQTTISQLYAVLAAARVVVAPDTGPTHLASAAGTPVIGLYASSNPLRTGPYNSRQWVVNQYPAAVEKYLHKSVDDVRWGQRVRDPAALDLLGFDQVIAMLDKVMASMSFDPAE